MESKAVFFFVAQVKFLSKTMVLKRGKITEK